MRRAPVHTFRAALLAGLAGALPVVGVPSALAETGGASSAQTAAPRRPASRHRAAIATWFGPGFYGQRTACGQLLTPAVAGVANRTLPCGTLVTFTYRGHSATLPVIDRGPYANGADWDLTSEGARLLGIQDTVRVAAKVVGRAPNSPLLGLPQTPPSFALTGGAGAA